MSFWDPGWRLVIGTLVVLAGVAAVAIYEGLYNIAADVPHTQPVYWLLESKWKWVATTTMTRSTREQEAVEVRRSSFLGYMDAFG